MHPLRHPLAPSPVFTSFLGGVLEAIGHDLSAKGVKRARVLGECLGRVVAQKRHFGAQGALKVAKRSILEVFLVIFSQKV